MNKPDFILTKVMIYDGSRVSDGRGNPFFVRGGEAAADKKRL
ncbi:MAG: hypothetical protein ACXWB7_07905 [Kaistella sp.]